MNELIIVENEIDAIILAQQGYHSIALGLNRIQKEQIDQINDFAQEYEDLIFLKVLKNGDNLTLYSKTNLTLLAKKLLEENLFIQITNINWHSSLYDYFKDANSIEKEISNSTDLITLMANEIPNLYNNGRQAVDGISEYIAPLIARIDHKYWGSYIENIRQEVAKIGSCSKSTLRKTQLEEMIEEAKEELEINIESNRNWFDGNNFKPPLLADYLQDRFHFLNLGSGGSPDRFNLYLYQNGVYKNNGETEINKILQKDEFLGEEWRKKYADDTISYIKRSASKNPIKLVEENTNNYENLINVRNGMLDIETMELLPHDPFYHSINQLNVDYKPDANHSRVIESVEEVLIDEKKPDHSKIKLFWEFLGWTIYNGDVNLKKMLFLTGSGDNGKSVLLSIINSILGRENYSSLKLKAIAESQFAASDLFGKLANINGDLDSTDITETSLIKQLTGGDVVQVDQKYKEYLKFKNRAKLIFALNELPIVKDYSNAYFERILILNAPNTFKPGMKSYDPNLIEKITTETAKSTILNQSIKGLHRLMNNDWQFTYCKTAESNLREYKVKANPVVAFLEELCNEKIGATVIKMELFDLYKTWSKENGYHAASKSKFLSRVRSNPVINVGEGRKTINGQTFRVFKNLEINEVEEQKYLNRAAVNHY